MNRMITSREDLLAAAHAIVEKEGMAALNIRALAQYCGIATGSVYNYFTSKSELMVAMAEDFWRSSFHPQLLNINRHQSFDSYLGQLYQMLVQHLGAFRAIYGGGLGRMEATQRQMGRAVEEQYIAEICRYLVSVLQQDAEIPQQVWSESFTPEKLARHIFDNLQILVMQGKPDCIFLQEMVRRIIYPVTREGQ